MLVFTFNISFKAPLQLQVPYNRVITPGRMQKNLGFETEIAQWAHTRQFFLWISTHFYSIFQVFCVYWSSGPIHAVGVITRLYGRSYT